MCRLCANVGVISVKATVTGFYDLQICFLKNGKGRKELKKICFFLNIHSFTENFAIKFREGDLKKIISLTLFPNKSNFKISDEKNILKNIKIPPNKFFLLFSISNNGSGGSVIHIIK